MSAAPGLVKSLVHRSLRRGLRRSAGSASLLVLLCGCQFIGPVEVATAQARFFLTANGAPLAIPKEVMLSPSQNQSLHDWLHTNRSGWSSRYDTTSRPDWCVHINLEKQNTTSLCRYKERVVLRGLGPEIERSLSEPDKSYFAQQIEALNS